MAKGDQTKKEEQSPTEDGGGSRGGEQAQGAQASSTAKLAARIGQLEQELAEAQRALSVGAIEREVEAALATSGVIDAETGRVLLAHELESSPQLGVEEALASLKRRKPFLFGSRASGVTSGAALAPSGGGESEEDALASLRESASASGDRAEVLKYLRARRTG